MDDGCNSEVDFGVQCLHLFGFVLARFGVRLGPFGSMWAVGQQSEMVTPSGKQFDPFWTDLRASLGPMLALCWAHACPMLEAVRRLGSFLAVLGAIWRRS